MIGTSIGLAYEDVFQHAAGVPHDYNVIDPETTPDINTNDKNEVSPKSKPVITEVQDKMPFPDNHNPDQDFAARFGNLPPSGILNDLKKPQDAPLIRRISDNTYLTTPYGSITDSDIDKTIGVVLNTTGGGIANAGETIGKAALRYGGKVYEDANHGLAFNKLLEEHANAPMGDIDQGFTTSSGRFVSREEAFDIAKAKDQIKSEVLPALTKDSTTLLSEDLKPNLPEYNHDAHMNYRIGGDGTTNFRRGANDNDPTLYNPREPNMIGSKEQDDAIDAAWKKMGESMRMQDEIDRLLAMPDSSQLHVARINKLQKQWQTQYGPGSK